jgi:hypothetical protein
MWSRKSELRLVLHPRLFEAFFQFFSLVLTPLEHGSLAPMRMQMSHYVNAGNNNQFSHQPPTSNLLITAKPSSVSGESSERYPPSIGEKNISPFFSGRCEAKNYEQQTY